MTWLKLEKPDRVKRSGFGLFAQLGAWPEDFADEMKSANRRSATSQCLIGRLCSAKTPRSSCSAGQEAVLIVKSLQDGVRHHAAGPVEAMPLALHLRGAMLARSR